MSSALRGDLPNNGIISFRTTDKRRKWEIHYSPKPSVIEDSRRYDPDHVPPKGKIILAKADTEGDWIETYPLNATRIGHGLFGPKYDILRTIRFENLNLMGAEDLESALWALKGLTDGFVISPEAGLGLKYELISLVEELETAGVTTLVVRNGPRKGLPTLVDGTLTIARVQFEEVRRGIKTIHRRALDKARDEKHRLAHNTLLTAVDATRFPEQPPSHEKGAIMAAIRAGVETILPHKDQVKALESVTPLAREVAARKPAAIQAFAREVELVTLDELIRRYESHLSKENAEAAWQAYFKAYPFVLRLAFGYPIIAMGDQISVGGGRFDGRGEKIADFAVAAAMSGNLALIEIKTPGASLFGATPYREGVYAPSRDLAGSVAQVLDQKYQLQLDFAGKKVKSRAYDLEAYAVQCLVIIGRDPKTDDEKKSFELFRRDLRQVSILTFDEMLLKLQTLREFLKSDLPHEAIDDQV